MAFTAFSSAFSNGVLGFLSVLLVLLNPVPGPLLNVGAIILSSSKAIGSMGNLSNQSSL